MIHSCKIHCHTIDPDKLDVMGLEDDPGKWMSFAFHMDIIVACKVASDDEDYIAYNCTTLFTETGDTFIIDTPYEDFEALFISYNSGSAPTNREPSL